jgi:hypothetical protein
MNEAEQAKFKRLTMIRKMEESEAMTEITER